MDMTEINRRVIEQFRAGGEIDGMHRERLLLLTTTGARTGQRRTTPMMFHRDGDWLLVVASNAGAPKHPDWYRNVLAEPHVTVEVGNEKFDAVAEPATGTELDRLWELITEQSPFFLDHQRQVARRIPVVVLTRISSPG